MTSMMRVRVGEIKYIIPTPTAAPRTAFNPSPRFSDNDCPMIEVSCPRRDRASPTPDCSICEGGRAMNLA